MKEKIITIKKGLKAWPKGLYYTPKYFKPYEMDCNGKGCCSTTKFSSLTAERLDAAREKTGRAITVTSWYRCPEHNKAVGGVTKSQHMTGKAADIKIAGMPANHCVQQMMEDLWFTNGGVGYYNTFTHVDTSTKRRWDGRSVKKTCSDYSKYYLKKQQPVKTITLEENKYLELQTRLESQTAKIAQLEKDKKELMQILSDKDKVIIEKDLEIKKLNDSKIEYGDTVKETNSIVKSIWNSIQSIFKINK